MAHKVTFATTLTVEDLEDGSIQTYETSAEIDSLEKAVVKETTVNNATATLWDAAAAGEVATAFDFCVLLCLDATVDVELTCNNGDANEALFTIRLRPDVPVPIPANFSEYNPGGFGGSDDVIDLIRVRENNTATARVRAFFFHGE